MVLGHPFHALKQIESTSAMPWAIWLPLGAIALMGSLIYGASLSLRLPWSTTGAALWLTLASGLGWLVLGPLLRLATGLSWRLLATACLLTMAYGEGILMLGALLNASAALPSPGGVNSGVVIASNAVMGATLAHLLRGLGVSKGRTWACWALGLDPSGALFFLLLRFLLAR